MSTVLSNNKDNNNLLYLTYKTQISWIKDYSLQIYKPFLKLKLIKALILFSCPIEDKWYFHCRFK